LQALQNKLMTVARASAPRDSVPYAFEKRIMARLKAAVPLDWRALWAQALWRGAVPCVALALLVGAWHLWQSHDSALNGDFSKEFETAALVASDQSPESW